MLEVLESAELTKFTISKSQYVNKDLIVMFGDDNLAPQRMNELFNGSQTVICAENLYENAVLGENDEIPEWLVMSVRDWFLFGGYYIMVSRDLEGNIVRIKHIPFEMCRLTAPDDSGRFNSIAVADWGHRMKGKKVKGVLYPTFDVKPESAYGAYGHTISIYHHFSPTHNFYPTSRFAAVLQDCSSEQLLQSDRWNALVNGSAEKIVIRTEIPQDEIAKRRLIEKVTEWATPKGSRILLCNSQFSTDGDNLTNDFNITTIPDNRNLIAGEFETRVSTNIAKAANVPATLIQSSTNMFSGEVIRQSQQLLIFSTMRDRAHFTKLLNKFGYDITLGPPQPVNFE